MANLAAKDIFNSYRLVPQPFRHMLLARSRSYKLFLEDIRKYRSDASAGEGLRLSLAPGTPVLAPADMRLTEAGNQGYGSWATFTGRRHTFTFYHLAFNDGLSTRRIKAGSAIGTVEMSPAFDPQPRLHMMVTKMRFFDGSPGQAVDAMALITKGIIRPPFMPAGLD